MDEVTKIVNLQIKDRPLRTALETVSKLARDNGGKALVVGGCVRDAILDRLSKELDIEVHGISWDRLVKILSDCFPIDLVGQSFQVIKIRGLLLDVSIPRRESKVGSGHKGFETLGDPDMDPEEALSRRDFTINSMAFDPVSNNLIDPFNGLQDIKKRILRHTSEKFIEDPLRVLRGMQLAARLDLHVAPETVALSHSMSPEGLPKERIFGEWRELILNGEKPSRGLSFLRECGWVQYFPEIEALIGCEQDREWHPEGDVWDHTLVSMDAFAQERLNDDKEDLIVGLAVLCHDLGKPATTKVEDGRIRSKGHDVAGEDPTRSFLQGLTHQGDLVKEIIPLVSAHLRPRKFFKANVSDSAIRRLAKNVGRIDRLVRVAKADACGSNPGSIDLFQAGEWLLDRARILEVENSIPKPIVMGRHLIKIGLIPGLNFEPILSACYNAQIDGEFKEIEEGMEYAKRLIEKGGNENSDSEKVSVKK